MPGLTPTSSLCTTESAAAVCFSTRRGLVLFGGKTGGGIDGDVVIGDFHMDVTGINWDQRQRDQRDWIMNRRLHWRNIGEWNWQCRFGVALNKIITINVVLESWVDSRGLVQLVSSSSETQWEVERRAEKTTRFPDTAQAAGLQTGDTAVSNKCSAE